MGKGVVVATDLDHPQVCGESGRQVDRVGAAVGPGRVDRGREGARRVHDDEVARLEEAGKIGEGGVHHAEVVLGRHQHAHCVACDAACLGRRRRFELRRQVEAEALGNGCQRRGHHAGTDSCASSCAL
jgi:hypothetical protein